MSVSLFGGGGGGGVGSTPTPTSNPPTASHTGSLSRGLFRSYYNGSANSNDVKGRNSQERKGSVYSVNGTATDAGEDSLEEIRILPSLLPGEVIVARAQRVHSFQPLSSDNQGIIGEVYITNFKLSFQTIKFPHYRKDHRDSIKDLIHPWTNGMIDIPLASICGLYRLSKNGRRKAFKIGPLKRLLVVCRNFRVEKLSFQQSSIKESHEVAAALAGYICPPSSQKERVLFVYQCASANISPERKVVRIQHERQQQQQRPYMDFSTRSDWLNVLSRNGSADSSTWRITQVNEHFHLCPSLPNCFVVPALIEDDGQLTQLCQQLGPGVDGRCIVWCWSHRNGAALCRMSNDVPSNKFVEAVTVAHPTTSPPVIYDINALCPGSRDVKRSYDLWRDTLLVESTGELESKDYKWFGDVEDSRWMSCVSRCLEVVRMVVHELMQRTSVILRETGDRDLNCLISALIQLCLDPACRQLRGFQELIEKEFVAMGHRFQDRLALVQTDSPDKESPIFLLFLDCVFQLCQQYVDKFEFNDGYLVFLWDTALLGSFKTFCMNCQRDLVSKGLPSSTNPTSVWQLPVPPAHLNPLYRANVLMHNSGISRPVLLSRSPVGMFMEAEEEEEEAILLPCSLMPFLKIWYHCYFRFIYPLLWHSSGGGAGKREAILQQHELLEGLCRQLKLLEGVGDVNGGKAAVTVASASEGEAKEKVDSDSAGIGMCSVSLSRRRSQLLRPLGAAALAQGYTLMTFQK